MTAKTLKERIAEVFGINTEAFMARKRMREFLIPRQVYAYLLEKYTIADRATIGHHINPDSPFDRNTIRNSVKTVKGLIYSDRHFAELIWEIEDDIDYLTLPFDRLPAERAVNVSKDPHYKLSDEERVYIAIHG